MARPRMIDIDETIETPIQKPVQKLEGNFYEITDLPSRFLLYPEGTKIFGRPMKVSEIKKLTTMNEVNYNSIIKSVLENCIKGIEIDELYVADKLYLIFWLRANTYTDANFVTSYICQHCGRKTEYRFNIDDFETAYLEDGFELKELKLLNRDTVLTFDFPKIKDEEKIQRFIDAMKNYVVKFDDDTVTIAGMIKTIDGKDVTIKQACEFINSLEDDPQNYARINSYVLGMDFGIVPELNATCGYSDCKEVSKVPASFQPDFFIPRYKS